MSRATVLPASLAFLILLLGGCSSNHEMNIPANATLGVQGNDRLTYTPSADGTFWIYDVNSDRIVFTGMAKYNDMITVDPSDNQIRINERVVPDNVLSQGDTYRIYFKATSMNSGSSSM